MTFSDSSHIPAAPLRIALNALMARHVGLTFPSCSLAVLHRGQLLTHGAWGASEGLAATTDTLFDIASISKLFTTTVFLHLVSSGLVGLDDPLCAVLPAFAQTGPRPIEGGQDPHTLQRLPSVPELAGQWVDPRGVTFRHLLTHTSGLPAWRDVYAIAGPRPFPPEAHRPLDGDGRWAQALPAIYRYPFIDQPGQRVVYSDIGLMLLGQAVQVVCRQPLEQVIETQLLRPLGLEHTMFNPVNSGRATLQQTAPTEMDLRWRQRRIWGEVHDENACGLGGVAGHAGLFATAMDVARFGQAWMDVPEPLGVDAELAAQAKTEQAVSDEVRRGLGFVIKSRHNASAGDRFSEDTFGHTGFTGTTLWVDPRRQCVVACLTNGVYFGRAAHAPHAFRRELHDLLAQFL
jgi:CubicO group peptidase (beta-lactamase class C family)